MQITNVKVKLARGYHKNLLGFCSVTFDDEFLVKDLKIINSGNGPFISMPSRKIADKCPKCKSKNHLRARYCNECGVRLSDDRAPKTPEGRPVLHVDIAHPLSQDLRKKISDATMAAYREESDRAGREGYELVEMDDA